MGNYRYLDWSLDWESLAAAPIWDSTFGFGGSGEPNNKNSLYDGSHCVTDGPFNNTWLQYRKGISDRHCLSRNFLHRETNETGAISGWNVRPDIMIVWAGHPTFDSSRNFTESIARNAIHSGVRGDFGEYSAANGRVISTQKKPFNKSR